MNINVFPVNTSVSDCVEKINKKYPAYTSKHLIKLHDPANNTCIVITNPEGVSCEFLIGKHEITSRGRPVKFHFVLDRNDYSSPNRLDDLLEFIMNYLRDYFQNYSRVFHIFTEVPHFKKEDFCITYLNHEIEIVFKNYFYLNNVTSNNRLLIDMMRERDDIVLQYKYTSTSKNTLAISDDIQDLHALIHYIPNDHVRKSVVHYSRLTSCA